MPSGTEILIFAIYPMNATVLLQMNRLEMLGHSLALLLKQQVLLGKPVDVSNVDLSAPASDAGSTKSHQHQADKRPMVAIIAPATSKGIDPHKLSNLAIAISLLPSLYATRSR